MTEPAKCFQRRRSTEPGEDVAHAAHVPRNRRAVAQRGAGAGGHVSTVTTPAQLGRELRDICGAEHVIEDAARLDARIAFLASRPSVAVEPSFGGRGRRDPACCERAGIERRSCRRIHAATDRRVPSQIDVLLCTSRLNEVRALRSRRSDGRHRRGLHGRATVVDGGERWIAVCRLMPRCRNAPRSADCWPLE